MPPSDDASANRSQSSPSESSASVPEETLRAEISGATPTGPLPGPASAAEDPGRTQAFLGRSAARPLDELSTLGQPRPFGNYELLSVLGRGGMGIVFKARQKGLDRLVAVKMIRSGELASEDEVARFHAEAQAAAKIEHPHVVRIYDVGEIDGHHFFSMDYLEGRDLANILREGPLDSQRAARIALQMAHAVQAAHDQGILHRDLKPANIVLDEHDFVTVTDFGLAKHLNAPGKAKGLTQSGAALGTPSYMSPEQAAGRHHAMGPASDVYSLGAVLYAMCCGGPPFHGDTLLKTMMAVIDEDPPPLRQRNRLVDLDLATICMKCLQKDPQRRYASASELARDLHRYLQGEPIEARPAGPLKRAWQWTRRIPLVAALMGRRVSEPSTAQRWTQRGALASVLLAVTWLLLPPLARQVSSNRMPARVTIAAAQPGGRYYELSQELANYLQAQPRCREARVQATEGSHENAAMLRDGAVQLAFMQESAIDGERMAVVSPVYYEPIHFLVRRAAGLHELQQINDRPISIGLPDSGMSTAATQVLNALQLRPQRRAQHFLDLWEDESLVGAIVTVGAPNRAIQRMLESRNFELLPLSNLDAVTRHPAFLPYRITAAQYPAAGIPESGVSTVATPAFLVTLPEAPAPLVHAALHWLFDHSRADVLSRVEAAQWRFMPLHAASKAYFGELVQSPQKARN